VALSKRKLKKGILIIMVLCCVHNLNAQMSLQEIDFVRIPQKKIKRYIEHQVQNQLNLITDLLPSCPSDRDLSDFSSHRKTYHFERNIDTVWNRYVRANPSIAWESSTVSFGCLVDKTQNEILYRDGGSYDCIDTGQVVYLNLKLLKGIYNLAVAFEVIKVDDEERTIEFSYIEGGKAVGRQQLKFQHTATGETSIIHSSKFRSNSHFRDKHLYPFFHEKLINQFHENMAQIVGQEDHSTLFSAR
jgi:hypothetical protein